MKILRYSNQTLVFFLELTMLGSFAYFGFHKGHNLLFRYILAFALPAIGILFWALWAAPKSSKRLQSPYLYLFRTALFLIAAYFLYESDKNNQAMIMASVAIITQVIAYYFKD